LTIDPARRLAEWFPRERRGKGSARLAIAVALSGGVDSIVLLHALVRSRRRLAALRALHVNHHISANAGQWADFCRHIARQWRVPLRVLSVAGTAPRGASLEEWARERRYELLGDALRPNEVLVTAHHADDQAETVLLQLLRGASVSGLAAMPAVAAFAHGKLARPLLDTSRAEIHAYAKAHGLRWVDDDSNTNERWSRNFLRRRVMPLIESRWPGATAVLARTALHMGEARALLEECASADLARIADGDALAVPGLRALPLTRRKNALRAWIASRGARAPEATRLEEIAGPLLAARPDAHPFVAWGAHRIQRTQNRLELSAIGTSPSASESLIWDWRRQPRLNADIAVLELQPDPHGAIDLDRLPAILTVHRRRGGERIRLERAGGSRSLKALLQQGRVPLAHRAQIPLIAAGTTLLAVGDRWLAAAIRATDQSRARGRLTVKQYPKSKR
jgi:tRNA(Ile)-lysidine synthase